MLFKFYSKMFIHTSNYLDVKMMADGSMRQPAHQGRALMGGGQRARPAAAG